MHVSLTLVIVTAPSGDGKVTNMDPNQKGKHSTRRRLPRHKQNTSLKSLHNISMLEDMQGQITITVDGEQLYHGGSWSEANRAIIQGFYGVAFSETGSPEFDPAKYDPKNLDSDPVTALLGGGNGLEELLGDRSEAA